MSETIKQNILPILKPVGFIDRVEYATSERGKITDRRSVWLARTQSVFSVGLIHDHEEALVVSLAEPQSVDKDIDDLPISITGKMDPADAQYYAQYLFEQWKDTESVGFDGPPTVTHVLTTAQKLKFIKQNGIVVPEEIKHDVKK